MNDLIKKIAKKSRILSNVVLQTEQEELITNLVTVVSPLYFETKEVTWNTKKPYDAVVIKCPCGKHIWDRFEDDYSFHPKTKEERIYYLWHQIYQHLTYEIRMKGDIEHIKLFERIIGGDKLKMLLSKWAEKNRSVAVVLDNYLQQLNSSLVNNE